MEGVSLHGTSLHRLSLASRHKNFATLRVALLLWYRILRNPGSVSVGACLASIKYSNAAYHTTNDSAVLVSVGQHNSSALKTKQKTLFSLILPTFYLTNEFRKSAVSHTHTGLVQLTSSVPVRLNLENQRDSRGGVFSDGACF
jgi:hypothetical protein